MGKWINFTDEQEESWNRHITKLPENIRNMILETGLRPDVLYLHIPSGRRVIISRVENPDTLNVAVYKYMNPHMDVEDFQVLYGVALEDLVPCESVVDIIDGKEMPELWPTTTE